MAKTPHQDLGPEALEVLRQRAASLAREATAVAAFQDATSSARTTYLVFRCLDERYGVPAQMVSEVVPLSNVVSVPGAPSHIVGLTRVRGKLLALVNLRTYFRDSPSGQADSDLAVVAEMDGISFGIVCSAVDQLLFLGAADVESPPPGLSERLRNSTAGFADRDVMLLDPKALLAQPGFVVR